MTAKVSQIRQPKAEDSGFVIALHVGSFSIRLVFARHGAQARPSRKERRTQAKAEAARWAEVTRLMAAQTLLDQARARAIGKRVA